MLGQVRLGPGLLLFCYEKIQFVRVQGSCASGFGTCCVVTLSTCGGTVTYNCTYITNPGYPAVYTEAAMITYLLSKTPAILGALP